eukprot:2612982-Prymnesium_polylepis.1
MHRATLETRPHDLDCECSHAENNDMLACARCFVVVAQATTYSTRKDLFPVQSQLAWPSNSEQPTSRVSREHPAYLGVSANATSQTMLLNEPKHVAQDLAAVAVVRVPLPAETVRWFG